MFRLMAVVIVLACVATARCGTVFAPVVGKLVSEKVVEVHGNNVVHASAPLAIAAPAVLSYATNPALPIESVQATPPKASPIVEKTLQPQRALFLSHDAYPSLFSVAKPSQIPIQTALADARESHPYVAPIYYSSPIYPRLVAEKTVSSYGYGIRHVA